MSTPLGSIFATNITPDKQTGIGNYSLADFDRAVRYGVTPDDRNLYPAMPYPSYSKISDDDMRALYAYFMRGVKPIRQTNRASEIPWPLSMRWPLAIWNELFTNSETYVAKAPVDVNVALWNRGAYIVQGAGHCGSCHTPRSLTMNEKAFDESDARFLSGALLDGWYAPSLRAGGGSGIGRWSELEIAQFLKTGRNKHAVVFGTMTEVVNNSTQHMTDEDLRAVAHYLRSLPLERSTAAEPWQYQANSNTQLLVTERLKVQGAQTFVAKCSACHSLDGRGQGQWIPPLAGSTSSMVKEVASSINVTLNGSGRIVVNGIPDAYRMPPFRNQLTDKEVADVLTFVRTSWGNRGGAVTEQDVKELRSHTNPASSEAIVLHMR